MSEWVETTLGDVAEVVRGVTYKPADVAATGGPSVVAVLRATNFDESGINDDDLVFVAAARVERHQRLRRYDVLVTMSTGSIRAIGKSCVIRRDYDSAFGGFLAVIRAKPNFGGATFLDLLLTSDEVRNYWRTSARGTSIRNLSVKAMGELPIALPPFTEQHRIVAVMAAVDAQIEALEAEFARASRILAQYLEAEFQSLDGPGTPIIDLCTKVIGGIWGLPAGESELDVFALGPRVYSFGTTTLLTKGSPLRSFTAKQVEGRLVRENDIILERSGGSPEQPVGRVVIADKVLAQSVPTDFQRLLRPDTAKIQARYLFWRLQSDWNTRETVKYSRRTTGITNLSVKDYIAREIAVPSRGEQERLVAVADSIEATSHLLGAELAALRTVRANLLSSLLSQEITVDAAVDQFVKAA